MSLEDYNIFSAKNSRVNTKNNIFPFFMQRNNTEAHTHLYPDFSSQSSEEYELNILNHADSFGFISSILDPNPMPSLNELEKIYSMKSYIRNDSLSHSNLFTNTGSNSALTKNEENMIKRKRFREKRRRRDNQDNMRKKIKRGFFNTALIKKLNDKLPSIVSKKYFEKFPSHLVSDINQKRNREIFNMTLRDIFGKKELYLCENKYRLDNYLHNLKIVEMKEIKENQEFQTILNKKICELYEEYINSEEFKIIEINRLKKKKMREDYITKYILLAKKLLGFFIQ